MDLADLLGRPEGKTLEFKRDRYTPEGAFTTVVTLAHNAGKTLLVGVEDGNRHVRGVRNPPFNVSAWRSNLGAQASSPAYLDIPGFCKAATLEQQFAESAKLEHQIRANFRALGYPSRSD